MVSTRLSTPGPRPYRYPHPGDDRCGRTAVEHRRRQQDRQGPARPGPVPGTELDPWHRHVSICMLAHAFLAVTRAGLGKTIDPGRPYRRVDPEGPHPLQPRRDPRPAGRHHPGPRRPRPHRRHRSRPLATRPPNPGPDQPLPTPRGPTTPRSPNVVPECRTGFCYCATAWPVACRAMWFAQRGRCWTYIERNPVQATWWTRHKNSWPARCRPSSVDSSALPTGRPSALNCLPTRWSTRSGPVERPTRSTQPSKLCHGTGYLHQTPRACPILGSDGTPPRI
jgi:hypothetical protein